MLKLSVSYAVVGVFVVLVLGFVLLQVNNGTSFGTVARPAQSNFVYFTFNINSVPGALPNQTIIKIDGISYKESQLPASMQLSQGSFNIYTYNQTLVTNTTKIYSLNFVNSSCGINARQGTFYATNTCLITAIYR